MAERSELLQKAVDGLRALAELVEVDAGCKEEESQMDLPGFAIEEKEEPVTFEQVQKVLIEKSRSGFRQQVQTMLSKHGATKLSDIKDEKELRSLLDDAEESCRDISKLEIVDAADSVVARKSDGYLSGLLAHYYANSVDELQKNYYAGFLWEARRME